MLRNQAPGQKRGVRTLKEEDGGAGGEGVAGAIGGFSFSSCNPYVPTTIVI